jgi:hypothetical protein
MVEIKGHRRFVGGFLDGHVDNMVSVTPSDFPLFIRYPNGSFYERDLDGGTEAIYRFRNGGENDV